MKCPIDGETLVISERSQVEIDYCPKCRGVWLDRGELDKIIERSGQSEERVTRAAQPHYGHERDAKYYKKKKKDSFLSELFDF